MNAFACPISYVTLGEPKLLFGEKMSFTHLRDCIKVRQSVTNALYVVLRHYTLSLAASKLFMSSF